MPLIVPPSDEAQGMTLGSLIDAVGVTVPPIEDTSISSAVVVLETKDGHAVLGYSQGMSWPDLVGLLEAGQTLANSGR